MPDGENSAEGPALAKDLHTTYSIIGIDVSDSNPID